MDRRKITRVLAVLAASAVLLFGFLIAQRLARAAVNRVAVQALQLVVPRLGLLQAVGGLAQQQIVRRTVEIQRGAVCYPRNVFPEIPPFSA